MSPLPESCAHLCSRLDHQGIDHLGICISVVFPLGGHWVHLIAVSELHHKQHGAGRYATSTRGPTLHRVTCLTWPRRSTVLYPLDTLAGGQSQDWLICHRCRWVSVSAGVDRRPGADRQQRADAGPPGGQRGGVRAQRGRPVVRGRRAAAVGHVRAAGAGLNCHRATDDYRGPLHAPSPSSYQSATHARMTTTRTNPYCCGPRRTGVSTLSQDCMKRLYLAPVCALSTSIPM